MNTLITKQNNDFIMPFSYEIVIPEKENDFNYEYSIQDETNPNFNENFNLKDKTENDYIDSEFLEYIDNLTKTDYILSAASGLFSGGISAFICKELSLDNAQTMGKEKAIDIVIKIAKFNGFKGDKDDIAGAIRTLEKAYPFASDSHTNIYGGGRQHHLRDFTHHPTITGLIFSIIEQFFKYSFGTDPDGKFIFKEITDTKYIGKNIYEKIYYATIKWAFHLISDMAGSSNTPGEGTGIPGPILSFLKEVSTLPLIHEIKIKYKDDEIEFSKLISKLFNGTYFEHKSKDDIIKFDLRTEMGIAFQISNQAIPVIINECIVRGFYFIKRLYIQIKMNNIKTLKDLKKLDPKTFLPINNRNLTHMITISSGVFFTVSTATAAVKAAYKGKNNFTRHFLLNINYVGVGRFTFALLSEGIYILKDLKETYKIYKQRQDVLLKETFDFKIYDYFSLNEKQMQILFSLKKQKVQYDINTTKDDVERKIKQKWLQLWEKDINENYKNELVLLNKSETYNQISNEVGKSIDIGWLYLITMELSLFIPYYPIKSKEEKWNKVIKYKSNFEEEEFCKCQMIISYEDYKAILKEYNKNIGKLDNKTKKIITGAGITAVLGIATGGVIYYFSPQIAVLIAGSSFANLSGAALTNASLAFIGGGSLATGGLGMAGGTTILTGGGVFIGSLSGGITTFSTLNSISSKDLVLSECAKFLTYCSLILVKKQNNIAMVKKIQKSIQDSINELSNQLKINELIYKDETIIHQSKKQKMYIKYFDRCNKILLNTLKD